MNVKGCENAVLSAIKYDNSLYEKWGMNKELCVTVQGKIVYEVMQIIIEKGVTATDVSINEYCNNNKIHLQIEYLTSLNIDVIGNTKYYVGRLKEYAHRKKLRVISMTISDMLKEKKESVDIREEIEKQITDLSIQAISYHKMKEVLLMAIEKMEKAYHNGGKISGIPCGYKSIDAYTNGFQNGELIIIASRPSIGKTSISVNMGINMIKVGVLVGFFTCEMSAELLGERILAQEARIKLENIKAGKMSDEDFGRIINVGGYLNEKPLLIDDTPNIKLSSLKSQARRMKRDGVQIIFIDYLTLINHDKKMPRWEKVGEISKALKQLARELNIPVVCMSQVGRQAEGKMPCLADLRMSGEIEEDSDVIIFLHRDREENETEGMVAKDRNGGTGGFKLYFKKKYTRFEELYYGRGEK